MSRWMKTLFLMGAMTTGLFAMPDTAEAQRIYVRGYGGYVNPYYGRYSYYRPYSYPYSYRSYSYRPYYRGYSYRPYSYYGPYGYNYYRPYPYRTPGFYFGWY